LTYPDGREETVLNVPKYDFNWQLVYQPMKPLFVPKGTKLRVDATFDNSPGNKFNPDPRRTVYPGRMTWEEMMSPFFGVITDSAGSFAGRAPADGLIGAAVAARSPVASTRALSRMNVA